MQQAILNLQQQHPQPHRSHSDPWAMDFICCDTPHSASTSSHGIKSPITFTNQQAISNVTSPTTAPHIPKVGCIDGEECCTEPNCGPVECCTDTTCPEERCDESHGPTPNLDGMGQNLHVAGLSASEEEGDALMEWACSKEGCDAIQQYVRLRNILYRVVTICIAQKLMIISLNAVLNQIAIYLLYHLRSLVLGRWQI